MNLEPDKALTKALEDAFREAGKLPEAEQDELAAAIHAEIESDSAWGGSASDVTECVRGPRRRSRA